MGSNSIFKRFSWFSNFGEGVDVFAPGEAVLSLSPDGSFAFMSGTSMSAAHVSGAAALFLALRHTATIDEFADDLADRAKTVNKVPKRTTKNLLSVKKNGSDGSSDNFQSGSRKSKKKN